MDNRKTGEGCGGSFLLFTVLLTVVFIVFKLTGVIDWDWIWVIAPVWIFAGLFFIVMALLGILTILLVSDKKK